MSEQRWGVLIISLLLALSMMGCVEMPDTTQTLRSKGVGQIHGTHTVGQTFVASHNRLSRIDVQLATYRRRNTQPIIFHLRSAPSTSVDIATITFGAEEVEDNAYRPFRFPPIPDSEGRSFYFFFESPTSKPGDAITVYYRSNDVYAEGQMVIQGDPQGGDLVFRAYYHYSAMDILKDIGVGSKGNISLIILSTFFFVLPGYALLSVLFHPSDFDLAERLTISIGLSIALMPLILFASSLANIRLTRWAIRAFFLGFGGIAMWRADWSRLKGFSIKNLTQKTNTFYLLLLFILLLSLMVRLLAVKDLSLPMWGDSYTHTILSDLIVKHGRLPASYRPYSPTDVFIYHFGFHAIVAFFHWLTGEDIIKSVLLVGQILNALSVLAVYLFAERFTSSRVTGLIAALITGLISRMPAFYVNVGRYTQLAGQFLLPFALVFTIETLDRRKKDLRYMMVAVVFVVALVLTHIRVTIFYLCFLLPVLTWKMLESWKRGDSILGPVFRLCQLSLASLVLVSPWVVKVLVHYLPTLVAIGRADPHSPTLSKYNAVGSIDRFASRPIIGLSVLGAFLAVVQRKALAILVVLWMALLMLIANPYLMGLPGTGIVPNSAVLIAFYIPLSLLCGMAVSALFRGLQSRFPRLWQGGVALLVVVALVGARNMLSIVDPHYALARTGDQRAMSWIRDNTPQEAKFLVNSAFDVSGTIAACTDGGMWIPFLTGRQVTVPPLYFGFTDGAVIERVRELAVASNKALTSTETLALLRERGVTHVYIGERGGSISPQALIASPDFRLCYSEKGVRIFALEEKW